MSSSDLPSRRNRQNGQNGGSPAKSQENYYGIRLSHIKRKTKNAGTVEPREGSGSKYAHTQREAAKTAEPGSFQ